MTTTRHEHPRHSPSSVLRRIGRALSSKSSPDRMDDVRTKQAHAAQVQFVRSFRM